ncbi:MAG: YceI family protein [Chitinophagales bacterium]
MKIFFVVLIMAAMMTACTSAPDAPKADAKEAKETTAPTKASNSLKVDTGNSSVTFIGTKPVGQHTGVVKLKEGSSISVDNGAVTGGKFEMDLTSFVITDLEGEGRDKLTGHLQSDDFFDVANHPTASFEITDVKPYSGQAKNEDGEADEKAKNATHFVSGNLTLKGVEKNISFPATMKVMDEGVKARANFNIDRTQFGLTYGNDKSLGDRFINPQVNIQLELVTERAM